MMGKNERFELISRNTEEIVTRDELLRLLEEKRPSAYCGYEPSGPVHLGHLMSMRKLKDFTEAGLDVKVLLADFHAWLNRKGSLDEIKTWAGYWEDVFKAYGINADFVLGSSFQLGEDYISDLFTFANMVTINRALRSMQQIARDIENARVSQIIYPLMQVLDIKHLGVDIALGGLEQRKIHMLAREFLPSFGYKAPVCVHHPLIVSLKGPETKMSSSKPETMIALNDDPEVIRERIRGAYCPAKQVEGNPVLQIARYVILPELGRIEIRRPEKFGGDVEFYNYADLEKAYMEGLHPLDLKEAVSLHLAQILEPIRDVPMPDL